MDIKINQILIFKGLIRMLNFIATGYQLNFVCYSTAMQFLIAACLHFAVCFYIDYPLSIEYSGIVTAYENVVLKMIYPLRHGDSLYPSSSSLLLFIPLARCESHLQR